jgi:hypothetical protein
MWDGTILMAKAIAAAWVPCNMTIDSSPNTSCVLAHLRNCSYMGISGSVDLDTAGDRLSNYAIVNIVNKTHQGIGAISSATGISVNQSKVQWSDGVVNRATGPAWGQAAHPPSTAPTVAAAAQAKHYTDRTNVIVLSCVLVFATVFLVLLKLWFRHDAKRKRNRPTDFREVSGSRQQ